MSVKLGSRLTLIILTIAILAILAVSAGPNNIGVCIRNCAQCKKMFGPYFEGEMCADFCVKFKGKIVPDCEDANSIAPFLTRFTDD